MKINLSEEQLKELAEFEDNDGISMVVTGSANHYDLIFLGSSYKEFSPHKNLYFEFKGTEYNNVLIQTQKGPALLYKEWIDFDDFYDKFFGDDYD